MINEQIVNLLTSGAAIVTILSGLNAFLGNKYSSLSKKIFYLSTVMLLCVFVKEIICLFDILAQIIPVIPIILVIFIVLNNRSNENLNKIVIATSIIIILIFLALFSQKIIINIIFDNNYISQIDNYIANLSSITKIAEVYRFILSNKNIVYTFSYILNIFIVILNFYLIYKLNDYLIENEDKISNLLFYSIALLILSCGFGVMLMRIIVEKF